MLGLFGTNCPNCGKKVSGDKNFCNECGSYVITLSNALKAKVYSSDYFPKVKESGRIYVSGYMLDKDEYPIVVGSGSYYINAILSLGGFLVLSNKRLIFHSHKLNPIGKKYYSFDLERVVDVSVGLGLLEIVDSSSVTSKFGVTSSSIWIENIKSVINSIEARKNGKNNEQKSEVVEREAKTDFIPPPPLL